MKEFYFGFDVDNIYEVMKYVKDNYVEVDDYEMSVGYGDDVMNYLEVKGGSSKLLKDEYFLELVDSCDGGGEFDED